ncbi:sensor histidine kinase, partial [Gordonibacter urolithinfaciens]
RTARSAAGSYGEEHGLGLVLVDRIARAHGGSIALESEPGRGFVVEVLLPLA